MEKIMIETKNLTKIYKMYKRKSHRMTEALLPFLNKHYNHVVLKDINLTVKQGEVLGILGKNGAGKSTLLKIITGVVSQTSGELNVNGKVSSLLELGTAFNPELTGLENIFLHGQVNGMKDNEIKSKKQEIIDFADIGEHITQPVKTYSSGMFARLAFACAINVDPDILIVDEVLSVGDIAFQMKCFKKFEEFKKKNKTILFVTHSINDIIRNCTRAIIIDKGNIIREGDTKYVVDEYKKLMVGQLEEDIIGIETEKIVGEWATKSHQNNKMTSYGNGDVTFLDYGIFDEKDNVISTINNADYCNVKVKIKINKEIKDPIFSISIKDVKGLELCGTNTLYENINTGVCKKNEMITIEFKQKIPLNYGQYSISFGCTKIDHNGEIIVYNRHYDALFLEVISSKDSIGIAAMKTEITINK